MQYVRGTVQPLLLFACVALLATSGCVAPPIAFHDGLPAWTPEPGRAEGSVGYHRMFWSEGSGSFWYLTPGVRFGLARPPLTADVGLTSVVITSGGEFGALLGPVLGIGYRSPNFCVVGRPSLYVLGIGGGSVQFNLSDAIWQFSLLAGNGTQAGKVHFSGGGRISEYGVGPVLLVGYSLGSVDLRAEASYMLPNSDLAEGQLLTVGLTVAGPAPKSENDLDGGKW